MAGEWLKMECATPDKPEVFAITTRMGWDDPDLTVGKLFRVWRWFDQQTTDGNAPNVTAALLDRIAGVTGFAVAMQSVGWLDISAAGISLPNFEKHTGTTAKARAQTAKRVANHRASETSNAESNAATVTPALAREEKRREEQRTEDQEKPAAPASPWLTVESLTADGLSAEVAAAWIAHRRTRKAKLTALAWKGFKAEVSKAGWDLEAAVLKAIARNWTAFEAEWVAKDSPGRGPPALTFRERDAANAAARVHEMTGGLVSAKPTRITRHNDVLQEVFDARANAIRLG